MFDWSGPYVGAHAGYMNGTFETDGWLELAWSFLFWNGVIEKAASQSTSVDGAEGGVYGGYNYQFANGAVIGIEGDWSWTDLKGTTDPLIDIDIFGFDVADIGSVSTELTQYGTLRGRIGHSFDRLLIYLTGGVAYGEVETNVTSSFLGHDFMKVSDSSFRVGYAAGFGAEYAINKWLSLKGELLMVDLGDETVWAIDKKGLSTGISTDIGFTTARVGLAAHF